MNLFQLFSGSFSGAVVERLGWVLVHSLWQFALVALAAGAAMRMLRRNSAALRYIVLVAAMGVLVATPLATAVILPDALDDQVANDRLTHNISDSAPAIPSPADGFTPRRDVDLAAMNSAKPETTDDQADMIDAGPIELPLLSENFTPTESLWQRAATVLRPWLAWIVSGWSLGVVLCGLRPLLGWHMLWRLRRTGLSHASDEILAAARRVSEQLGLRRAVRVMQSTLAQVPVVIGYLRPMILLPVGLAASIPLAQLEAILAHELAHVRRHDFIVNLLQTLVETLFFYHPAVWWLSRQVRIEREHCCDDLVVARLGNRVEYGRALVAIEELRGAGNLLALGASDGSLLARIRRIIGVRPDRTAARLRDRWPVAAMGLALIGLACLLMVNGNLVAKQAAVLPVEEETTQDADAPGLFAGEVVDAVTGKPIDGATVRFIFRKIYRVPGEKNEPVAELVFRNVGRFQFKIPESVNPDEALFVERTAEHPDYQSLSPSGQALKFILKNEPNLSRDFIRKVSLSPGKVVTGQVLDLDGRPAKGVAVTAGRSREGWQNGCAHNTTTDADGRYRLVVPADRGRGRIYVIPDHAAAVSRAISEEFGEQQAFKLLRGTRLFGTVSDAQGRGVAGVVVRADGTERVPWRFAVTDAEGRYSLPPCQYGDYLIELVDEGRFPQLPTAGTRLPDVFLPHFVQLPRRAPTEQRLDFMPTESVHVVARYLTSDDHPVTGRGLSLHGRLDKLNWWGLFREVTDDPGLYELRVPRGLVGRIDQNFDSGHFLRIVRDSSDAATTLESKFDENNRAFRVRRLKEASVTLRPQFNGLSVKPSGPLTFPRFADPKAAELLGARIASAASKAPDSGGVWFDVHPEIDIALKLAIPGFKPWEQIVQIHEGEDRIIDVALESDEGAAAGPPAAAPPAEPASLRVRNADGGKAVFNSVVKAQLGFPKSKAESWVGWQTRDGLVPLKDLPAGTHWLIAAAEFEQRTPFQLKIPAAQPVIEQRLRAGQGWTARNIDLEVTVQPDEKNGDLIVVEIRNPSKDPLRVSEEDLHLTADHDKEQVRGLSPLWLTADRRPFPQTTIPVGETGRLSLRWTDWVTRGLWVSRNSEVMSEPAFPPPVPGKRWIRVWLGNGSALPVSVTDPSAIFARLDEENEAALERYFAPYRNLRDEDVGKFVLDKLRTPFEIDPEGGSWQSGAFEAQLLGSLSMVRQQDRLVKALLKVVDGTEESSMDQRRLAMTYLAGAAPRELLPLLIKELDTALRLPAEKKFPFVELEVLERMGDEGKEALPVLVKVLDAARDEALRAALIRTLASVGPSSKEALQAIASRFDERSSVEVRSRAIYEAARYGELAKPLGPKFTELLQSQSPRIRIWAAWALVTSKADEARGFDVLIANLAKGTAEDRGLSATALAALGKRAQSMLPRLREYENDQDDHVAKEVRDAIRRIQIDDRIFTHAEEAAKAAESRKAVAEARAGLQAASEPSAGKKPDARGKSNGSDEPGKPNRDKPETNTPKAKRLNGDVSDRPIRESSLVIRYDIPGGEPTTNIAIRAVDENRDIGDSSTGRLTWTTVENGGTLTVDHLAAGLYRVSRIRIFPLLRNESGSVYSEVRRLDETDVRLDARDTQTVALSRPRGRKLTGRISGIKEQGLASAVIHICSPRAKNIRALGDSSITFYDVRATDADGKFEIEPLSPGRYMLLVAGHKLKDPQHITPSDIDTARYFASREVVIEETGAIPPVELMLSPVVAEHEKERPAAWKETVVEGATDESKDELADVKRLFEAVQDHSPLKTMEMPAYWRMLGWVQAQSFAQLEKRAQWDVLYSQLLEGPDKHRGELLRLRSHVTRVRKYDLHEVKTGNKTVYEVWGSTDDSKSFPYVLLTTELPPEFKLGENEPNEGVFVGYFLKWMSYPAPGGKRTVPLLLGRMKHWPQEAAERPRDDKAEPAKLGTLTGKFIFDGEPPARKDLAPELSKIDANQRQLPGPDGRYSGVEGTYREFLKKGIRPKTDDPSLLVGKDGGIANVLVWVVSKDIPWALSLKEEVVPPAILRLKDGNYAPRISVATPGQGVRVENHDPVQFHFHLPLVRNQAINVMLAANSETWVDYGLSENLPVLYRSDIGTWANGWLFIPGNPFVAVSRPDGSFSLPNLPPGEWEFRVWHERKGFVQHWPKGLFKYTVKRGANDLGTIKLKPEFFAEKLAEPAPPKKPEQESDKTGAEIPEAVRPLLPSIVTVTKINLKSGRPEPDPSWRSGVVVDDRGFILTMWLSGDADRERLTVRLADQSEFPAEVVGADSKLELAVLRIRPARPLTAVSLSKVRLPQKGDAVWSVPSPAQKESKAGVVTGIRQFAGDMFTKTFIESDLPLPLGEGGSLMVADKGEPVGVWIAIRAGETRSSYAIALNDVQPLLVKALPPRAAERPQNPAPSPDEKNPTKQPSLKITVTLEPERREILLGEPAWLAFKVINPFDTSRGIGTPRGDWYGQDQFQVEVVNPRGERISRELPAPKLPPVEGRFPVAAKGDRTLDLFLPHWVKFTEPGKYRVTARRRLQIFAEKKKEFGNTEYEDASQIVDAVATTEIEVLPSDRDKLGKLIDQWGTTAARDEKLGRNGDEVNRAVMMLQAIDDERAIPWFLELLKLPVLDDKQRGCQGLAKFASAEAFNALKGAVTSKPEDFPGAASREQAGSWADAVQHAAAVALSESPHPAAADYLLTHAGHASENVRRVVLRHAHKLSKSKPEARQVIDNLTKDQSDAIRDEAKRYQKELSDG